MTSDLLFRTESGVSISYKRMGRQDPDRVGDLVFFNGLMSGSTSWAFQYRNPQLVDNFGLVFFDYRCQGASSQIPEQFGFEDIVKDIGEFLLSLKLIRPSFIGHSFGGILARILADSAVELLGADRIRSLVIVNSSDRFPDSTKAIFSSFSRMFRTLGNHNDGADRESIARGVFQLFPPLLFGNEYLRKLKGFEGEVVSSYVSYNPSLLALSNLLDAILGGEDVFTKSKPLYKNPILVVGSREDRIMPLDSCAKLVKKLENAELAEIEGAGHVPMLEQRRAFSKRLTEYLGRIYELELEPAL